MSANPNIPEQLHTLQQHLGPTSPDAFSNNHLAKQTNGPSPSTSAFQIHQVPVENYRPLRVVVVGAGYSGIYLAIRLPERLRNISLTVYDKNTGVGGTWFENKYPGCACDIPAHSYQYSFNPNTQWSSLYAPAAEIQQYLEGTAKKYGADRFMKLGHKVQKCVYDEEEAKWKISVKNLATGEDINDEADILINARGSLNEPNWPDIEGMKSFEGKIVHSAVWDTDYDFANKTIGIIGSGSSSIQIVPALQKLPGTQISTFVRNQTWISPSFGQDVYDELGMQSAQFTDEQKATFAKDPTVYQAFRQRVEEGGAAIHSVTMRGTPMQQGGKEAFSAHMKERLASRPDIYETLLPSFAPGCRRLTPGVGYLEALCEPNVEFITSGIDKLTSSGIVTKDGKERDLDVLVCATGFKTSAPPPFPILGKGGKSLEQHWKDYPATYLGVATAGFPSFFMMLGPNSAIGSGSLTMMIESVGDYVTKCVRKVQKEGIRSMEVKPERVEDFKEYCREYFKDTVFTDDCRSWYKNPRGDITGLWPGSTQHCIEAMRSPVWNHFEYTYAEKNQLAWLGNGWSDNQMRERHLAWYIYPQFIDTPVPGAPETKEEYDIRPFAH